MWLKLTVFAAAAAAADSATNSPLAFTVSRRPLIQKLHLSDGLQSMGSGGGDDVLVAVTMLPGVGERDESCDVWLLSEKFQLILTKSMSKGLYCLTKIFFQ